MNRTQARRSLAWSAAATLAAFVAVTAYLDTFRLGVIDPEYYAKEQLVLAAADPGRLTVCVGSSRVMAAVTPAAVPAAAGLFNLGHTGAGPAANYLNLSRLYSAGVVPRRAVIELMPAFCVREDEGTLAGVCRTADAAAVGPYVRGGPFYAEYVKCRIRGLVGHVRRTAGPVAFADAYDAAGGWRGATDTTSTDRRAELIRLQAVHYGPRLRQFAPSAEAGRAVRNVVALCRRHGTDPVLILMPEGRDFRAMYGPGAEGRFVAHAEGLAADPGVRLVNARDWLAESDMADSHHALRPGAVKFTARLAAELAGHD